MIRTERSRSPRGSAGGPKGYGDEQDLHRDSEPQACGRLAMKSYASACGVNIGRQDSQEKSNQRVGGDGAELGKEKSDCPSDFTDAREINHRTRPRNRG